MADNKNSFRDMILIIFVVLVCFGITIYGIAYLTGKVFSESGEVEVSGNDMPKEVSTNPQDGDTLTFTTMQEQGDEVMPNIDDIITTVTPPENNVKAENEIDENNIIVEEEKPIEVANNTATEAVKAPAKEQAGSKTQAIEQPKKAQEQVKQTEVKKQEPKQTTEPKKVEQKKAEPKQAEVKKEPQKQAAPKEQVKTVAPKVNGAFVVQIAAVQSKESADKEMAKYRAKFPDVFVKQVQINGKTWYRVRLGVSATRDEAEQKAKRVTQEFGIKPIVTKNN